jgi:type I restriction enzyme S subunit
VICEENNAFTLPRNWLWTSIREASVLVTKGSTPTSYGFGYTKQGINFVKVENMANGCVARETIKEFVTQEAHDFLKRSQLAEKDVLFSIAGTIGRIAVVRGEDLPANINQAIAIIRCPWRFLNPQYLKTFLGSTWTRLSIQKKPRGVGMNNVSLEDVKNIIFPLAPINEQIRIVAKLEELFARLDAGVGGLRKVKAQLKRYRQAVLKYAFEGKLTEEWRKTHKYSLENTKEFLEQILENRREAWEALEFSKARNRIKTQTSTDWKTRYKEPIAPNAGSLPSLPEGWMWVNWGQLSVWVTYGFTRPMPHVDDGVPIVTAKNIVNRRIDFDSVDRTTRGAFNALSDKDRPKPGDILITKDGTIGNAAMVPDDTDFCINQSVAVAWLRSCPVDRRYLIAVIESPTTQKLIWAKARGVAIQHLSITDFAKIPLPLPPIEEQKVIAEEIDRHFSTIDELKKIIEQSFAQTDNLRQSILKKAFEGKLVAQDPGDEPAEKLLERIKAEMAKSKGEKDTNKKKIKPKQLELSTYVK